MPGFEESKLEVVDGQQRLRAVFDFLAGDIRLSRSLDGPWAGKKFGQLDEATRNDLLDRRLTVFQYKSVSDQDVLQIFERFNVNSIQLNAQELRNGRFFGQFKQSCYGLAREYLEFWRDARIFSDQAIARMLEVEFVSELLVMQQDGLQDKKNSITDFYDKLDDDWPARAAEEDKFRSVIDSIASALGPDLAETAFTKRPLFYTLCGAVAHRQFGIPDISLSTPRMPLTNDDEESLRETVFYWTEVLSRSEDEAVDADTKEGNLTEIIIEEPYEVGSLTATEVQFREASTSQTDNVIPRRTRLTLFYNAAFDDSHLTK